MNEEEKKAIAFLRFYVSDDEDEYFSRDYCIDKNIIETILNLIEKQQKEIEEQKERLDGRYYHSVKLRELEIAIEEDWRNKIKKLKEKVEKERISNPYDFSYMLKELLGE